MKYIVVVLLLCLGATIVNAQEVYNSSGKKTYKHKKKTGYDPDRLVIGGGLVAGFGNGYTNVGVSPIVGYRISKNFSTGIGVGYQYFRVFDFEDLGKKYYDSYHIVYPSVWTKYFVYRNIFVGASFEHDFIMRKTPVVSYTTGGFELQNSNLSANCALVGVGLKQHIGGRVSFIGELMYDVLQQDNSPYFGSPVLRFGIVAGL